MSELRQNFATKEWVVIATERARRPEEMARHRERKPVASFVANCPFCPGNEKLTPPEILRVPSSMEVPWHARVIPNKFAALSRDVQPTRTVHRSRRVVNGFGVHDVIIETPDHSQILALMPDSYVAESSASIRLATMSSASTRASRTSRSSRITGPMPAPAWNTRTPR